MTFHIPVLQSLIRFDQQPKLVLLTKAINELQTKDFFHRNFKSTCDFLHYSNSFPSENMKLTSFLIFALFGGVFGEVSDLRCIESYLEKIEITLPEDSVICQNLIRNYTAKFETEFWKFLDPAIDRVCAKDVFDKYRVTDLYLKGLSKVCIF